MENFKYSYRNLITCCHFGWIFRKCCPFPLRSWPFKLAEKRRRDSISATSLSPEGTHKVRNCAESFNICKCTACAQRSKGCLGHLHDSNHACATVLSILSMVVLCEQILANFSQVMSAAKNSATLMRTPPGVKCGV